MDRAREKATLEADNAHLRERLRLLEDALETMPDGLCMFDPAGRIAVCNRRYAEVLGLPADDVRPGTSVRELVEMRMHAGAYEPGQTVEQVEAKFWDFLIGDGDPHINVERGGRTYESQRCRTASGNLVVSFQDASERLKAKATLRERNARLTAILDAMPDCVKIFDAVARLTYINPRGLKLVEAPDLATLTGSGHVPVPPEYLAECVDVHGRVIAGETVVWTYEIVGMQGGRRHVEAHSVPFRMPDGAVAHMCISRDISERQQAEDALRRSEERLRLVQEMTGLADFESAPGDILMLSERFVEQSGLPAGTRSMTRAEWIEVIHPDDREHFERQTARSLATSDTIECEFRIVRPDSGDTPWIYSRTRMERDATGRVRAVGAHLDITDRKRTEEALRESEERFRLAAEAAGLGVWDYDAQLDERSWSGRLRQIFGLAHDEPASFDVAAGCVRAEDRADFLRRLNGLRDGKFERFEASFRINRADDGRERWVTFNGWRTHKADTRSRRIIMTVRDATDEKTAEERIRWSASHDSLTRLANRVLFQRRLDQAIARARDKSSGVGVLMLDLDHFKQINDSLGHDVGDALLKMFAERLRGVVRAQDTVARLGGDEFAIVVPNLRGEADLTRLSRSIQERLRAPFVHGGRLLDCRVSTGASMFPDHGRASKEVLKNADMALYAAKSAGRATLTMYEPHMRQDMLRRMAMVQLAREAIEKDRVIPYYQPKLDLQTGAIDGFEALLRWRMPNGRIGQPASLEAAFEDLEVAAAISDRMIDRVIADMRGWLDRGIAFKHVAVNASAAEFRRDNFAERVLDQLRRADIPARCFQLEVTETVFLGRGAEYVHRALALLSTQGVKIALDDFGTGYASLRHLKQFPVDIIKIDRSFVRDMEVDPGDEAIVRAVINLGKSLGIAVVAEGIEAMAQAERLQRLGCDFGQGFLFAKAVGAGRVPPLVGKWQGEGAPPLPRSRERELRLVASRT